MSTILDALKKSEQERKLSNIPTLADMPTPQEPSRWQPVLLWAIFFLLVVLIGFVIKLAIFPSSGEHQAGLDGNKVAVIDEQAEVVNSVGAPESSNDIVVSVVSYSDVPSKRFIMLNGKLVREGEFVRAGLKVEEIRQNEVVLNLRGEKITRRP